MPDNKRTARRERGGISACIIAQNEERRLPRCLQSLDFVDEIVLVDGGSDDGTAQLAKRSGARVIFRAFDDYVSQKNFAVSRARNSWVLVVDADEVVTPSLKEEILAVVNGSESGVVAYRIPRINFYLGFRIRFSGWYPDYTVRLFRKEQGRFVGGTVHERLEADGPVGTLKNPMEHYSYSSISEHLVRIDQYSTLIARDKHERGLRSSVLWSVAKSASKFMITYFYHLGFLDGRPGVVIAILGGYYNFLKYIKLWELNRKSK